MRRETNCPNDARSEHRVRLLESPQVPRQSGRITRRRESQRLLMLIPSRISSRFGCLRDAQGIDPEAFAEMPEEGLTPAMIALIQVQPC